MTDKRPENLAVGETMSVSEIEDAAPIMVIAAPLVGIPVSEHTRDSLFTRESGASKIMVAKENLQRPLQEKRESAR